MAKIAGQPTDAEIAERASRKTQGMTSKTHKKYVNKIAFSNEVIDFQKEDESQFISTYKIGDPLWLRVYMDNSLTNYMLEAPESKDKSIQDINYYSTYLFTFYLDGKKINSFRDGSTRFETKEKDNWTTFKGAISSKEDEVFYFAEYAFVEFLIAAEHLLTPGSHDFKMEIEPYFYQRELGDEQDAIQFIANKKITGELKLQVDGPLMGKIESKACLPKPHMRDAKMEANLLTIFKNANPEVEVLGDVIIIQKGWGIVRNKYTSVPENKYLYTSIPVRKNGKCTVLEYKFIQIFNSVGYEKIYPKKMRKEDIIPCSCLEKL